MFREQCQAPGFVEARLGPFHLGDGGLVGVEVGFSFDGWDVTELAMEASLVEPIEVLCDGDL